MTEPTKFRKLPRVSTIPKSEDFYKVLESIKTTDNFSSPLTISVFVICGSLNSTIDLNKLIELYENDENKDGSMIISWDPESKKSKAKIGDAENSDSFYNSLKIDSKIQGNNISAKIFKNGKIHITGCRTIEIVHKVPVIYKNYLENYYPECIVDIESYTLYDQTICMINTLTNLNREIDRENMKNIINDNTIYNGGNWRSAIRPKRHQGVIARYLTNKSRDIYKDKAAIPAKVPGQVTVIIFRSGKVIITGGKTLEDIKEAYDGIVKIVRDNEKTVQYDSDSD